MYQAEYFIDKSSNTFADNLAAFGLAFVLNGIADGRAKIFVEDNGAAFVVRVTPALREEWVAQCKFFAGAQFLVTLDRKSETKMVKGTKLKPALALGAIDYENEKGNNRQFFDWMKALPPEQKKLAARGELDPPARPHEFWDVFRAINPGALQGYNGLLAEWQQGRDAFPELLRVVLQMTAQTPNDVEGAENEWEKICKARGLEKPKAPKALQLWNPAQGKGVNSRIARWSNPNNVPASWLLEWLKVVGFYQAAITRIVANPSDPRNAKDRKTYVLHPQFLEWGAHQTVMKDFRQAMVGSATAIKLDVLATLRYTRAFLKHFEEAKGDAQAFLFGKRPSDLVSGMETAFYKSLGQSPAVMNIASINLPRWVNPQAAELALLDAALDEHTAIVRGLDETRGEQFGLLGHYRDFLSGNDLNPFFEFTTAYSGFIISQRERKKYVRQFTTNNLEVMIVNSDTPQKTYATILQDEGFKNVAYAIRHSTVIPQGRKAKGKKPVVDIRYGLGQQLARKANYPDEFLAEIAAFLQAYNAENSQLRENKREPFRKNVTTQDIEALAALIDEYGAKTVCNLLIAYGYAKTPYEKGDEEKDADDLEMADTSDGAESEAEGAEEE
ncbi:MAG: hypothetical protein B6D41_11270 [Chloroflexi bacterium UTCFX4]|jgi:hypothetical protein|nr:MAG: hypothetical protein B6D41_11270 [Chloroflexi bacterium UTCFX4]